MIPAWPQLGGFVYRKEAWISFTVGPLGSVTCYGFLVSLFGSYRHLLCNSMFEIWELTFESWDLRFEISDLRLNWDWRFGNFRGIPKIFEEPWGRLGIVIMVGPLRSVTCYGFLVAQIRTLDLWHVTVRNKTKPAVQKITWSLAAV